MKHEKITPTPNDPGTWLTDAEIMAIPQENLPLLVLAFNYRSFFSVAINKRKSGDYNHLMWMHRPGKFASQDWWYKEVPAQKYMTNHRLKFWHNPSWTPEQKIMLQTKIFTELAKPRWKTRYDVLALFGQLIGVTGIQLPWTNICSDYAKYLKIVDADFNLKNPAPSDVNKWLTDNHRYFVYGRFVTD